MKMCNILKKIFKFNVCNGNYQKLYDINKTKQKLTHLTHLTEHLDILELAGIDQSVVLRAGANNLDIPIWGKNQHGRFVFLNEACAKKILHGTIEAALNFTDVDFKNDALAPACMESDKLVMDSGMTRRFIEHAEYDGVPFWMDCTKSPWIQNGHLIGTVGSGKDITSKVPPAIKEKYKKAQTVEIDINISLSINEFKKIFK